MNLLVTSITATITASVILVVISFLFVKFLFEQWELKEKMRLQQMARPLGETHDPKIKHLPIMKTEIERPEPTSIMNMLLEDAKAIRMQLKQKEDDAKALKQWLNENPKASDEKITMAKKQLLEALQAINDLVCKLKPRPQIIIR